MTDHALPDLDPGKFPILSGVERPFFEYWWQNIISPDDPQKLRWVDLEERQPLQVGEYAERLQLALPLKGARVLDIGCQNGATLVALLERGAVPTGIEIDARCVEAARIRMRCHGMDADVRAGSACAMPFADGAFDAVLASNVIEHVESKTALLDEVCRVLRPGGVLYIDGPNRFSPRNFWSDPHYQLVGVSALPAWLSRAYVTKVRRFPTYDAETFPLGSAICQMLEARGFSLLPVLDAKPRRMPALLRRIQIDLVPMFFFLARKN